MPENVLIPNEDEKDLDPILIHEGGKVADEDVMLDIHTASYSMPVIEEVREHHVYKYKHRVWFDVIRLLTLLFIIGLGMYFVGSYDNSGSNDQQNNSITDTFPPPDITTLLDTAQSYWNSTQPSNQTMVYDPSGSSMSQCDGCTAGYGEEYEVCISFNVVENGVVAQSNQREAFYLQPYWQGSFNGNVYNQVESWQVVSSSPDC